MYKLILQVTLFFCIVLQCCTDQRDFYTYFDHNYQVDYPSTWRITHETDGLKISPKDNYGEVKIANYPTSDRPVETMKEFMLGLSNTKDSLQNIKMSTKRDVIEYYYEYVDNGLKRIIKLIRKENNFHLLRLSCQLNEWPKNEYIFLHITESFHFRNDR